MKLDIKSVRQLQKAKIQEGSRWIFVADFNIEHKGSELKNTKRIDVEVPDAKYILDQGGIVLFLAHKGRFKGGDTEELEYVIPHLSKQLETIVVYHPENNTEDAVDFSKSLKPGTAAVMGNARKHEGEEINDLRLAEQFARLGQYAAIGGFGKAHRKHASNVGIQAYVPAYATQSQLNEMTVLAPWAEADANRYSVAVLGGVKKEKITVGFVGFSNIYDVIIPGGIVLNTILKVLGYQIGDSLIEDGGKTFEKEISAVLDGPNGTKVCMPDKVVVARYADGGFHDAHVVETGEEVDDGYMIVDCALSSRTMDLLEKMVQEKGRLVLAGTPGIYPAGFRQATKQVLSKMIQNQSNCVVLGGDTAAEVDYSGTSSTGGGSALHFLVKGTTDVFEALKINKQRFDV
jgi:phosphoglycerate kinase